MSKSTPEGKIKEKVKSLLNMYGCVPASMAARATLAHDGWYFMPVGGPMSGVSGIPDFVGHFYGRFFAIETKADETKKPTVLQQNQISAINISGANAFVVGGPDSLSDVETWLTKVLREELNAKQR